MSNRERSTPCVPPVDAVLVSGLRDLFARLPLAQGTQAEQDPVGQMLQRLFLGAGSVPLVQARQDLPEAVLNLLFGSGLLRIEQGFLRPLFKLQIFRKLYFLTDLPCFNHLKDYVLPIGSASRHMARLAIRRPAGQALDMGCGSGVQSLLLAAHAGHVLATDINPRALALTALNAALNRIENVETRRGSLFEPLQDQTFDLILFNAPYILSPLTHHPHSHAGRRADAYLYDVLAALPDRLNEGGFAQIVTNWVHPEKAPWQVPLQAALSGLPLDALVLRRESLPAHQYADFWIKYEVSWERHPLLYALTTLIWRSWYRRRRIERIGFGSLVLRKRSGAGGNWQRFEEARSSFGDSLSDQMLAIFHNQDRTRQGLTADVLLRERPGLVNFNTASTAGGQDRRLVPTSGQTFPLQIRHITDQVLLQLDGRTTLEDAIGTAARLDGLQVDVIRPVVLDDMLNLARFGWIQLDP